MRKVFLAVWKEDIDIETLKYVIQICHRTSACLEVIQVLDVSVFRFSLENTMAAVAFAEQGDFETASIIVRKALEDKIKQCLKSLKIEVQFRVNFVKNVKDLIKLVNKDIHAMSLFLGRTKYTDIRDKEELKLIDSMLKTLKDRVSVPLFVIKRRSFHIKRKLA